MKGRYFMGRLGRDYTPAIYQGLNWCGKGYRIRPDGTGRPDLYPAKGLNRRQMSRRSRRANLRRKS